jgi:hypothetical protein
VSGSRTMIAGSLSNPIAGFHQSCRSSPSSGPRRSWAQGRFSQPLGLEVTIFGGPTADRRRTVESSLSKVCQAHDGTGPRGDTETPCAPDHGTFRERNFGMAQLYQAVQKKISFMVQQLDWLGREDSNLRMAESKSAALPLGYAPKHSRTDHTCGCSADQLPDYVNHWCGNCAGHKARGKAMLDRQHVLHHFLLGRGLFLVENRRTSEIRSASLSLYAMIRRDACPLRSRP